jgi:hypothetical protein
MQNTTNEDYLRHRSMELTIQELNMRIDKLINTNLQYKARIKELEKEVVEKDERIKQLIGILN